MQPFRQDLLGWRLSAEKLPAGEFCQTPSNPFICFHFLSQFSLVFFSLSGLLKSYVLGPVPGTGVTGQWGCQGPALSGSMGQVLMKHCGPKDAVGC